MLAYAVTPKQITAQARMKNLQVLGTRLKEECSEPMRKTLRMFSSSDKFSQAGGGRDRQYLPYQRLMRAEWDLPPHVAAMLARSPYWRGKASRWTKGKKALLKRRASDSIKRKNLKRLLASGSLSHLETKALTTRKRNCIKI